jgi:myo-inositol-1(or 4)-monophosphatase
MQTEKSIWDKELNIALTAAKIALNVIQESSSKKIVTIKGRNDFATEVDVAVENAIIGYLQTYSNYPIQGEEGSPKENSATRWIIDPIDGTSNFISGIPIVAVTIALLHENRTVVGVIASVQSGELFSATLGGGAYVNGKRLVASEDNLNQVAVMTGSFTSYPDHPWGNDLRTKIIGKLGESSGRVRMIGTAATDLIWTASGWAGACLFFSNNPWDVCAGILMVQEAGGIVTDLEGNPWNINSRSVLAAGNENILNEILPLIHEAKEG